MKKLTKEEDEIHQAIYNNSLIFFRDFVKRLVREDDGGKDEISNELVVLVVASLQISMELALKAYIIRRSGLVSIIDKVTGQKTHSEILNLFKENKLKSLQFEQLKIFVSKNQNEYSSITSTDVEIMTDFQRYRNGIVHLSFNFHEGDYFDLKSDIIYFVVNILVKILSGDHDRPSEFMENQFGSYFNQLLNYPPYISAMEKFARTSSDKVFRCILCDRITFGKETDYCYACNFEGELAGEFINCVSCKELNSVMYDHLNISINDNMMNGRCLNCSNDCTVFKCPTCEIAYNFDSGIESCTNENGCVNM